MSSLYEPQVLSAISAVAMLLMLVITLLLYGLPAASSRLAGYAKDQALEHAVATANAAAETEGKEFCRAVDLATCTAEGEVL